MRNDLIYQQLANSTPSTVIGFTSGGTPTLYPVSGFSGGGSGIVTGATNGLRMSGNGRLTALGGTLTGNTTVNTNNFGIVFGYNSTATGTNSFAEGYCTQAIGNNSHAEGYCTQANGIHSHAEGYCTCANGGYSHAEGSLTFTIGNYSHAEGIGTCAIGYYSHSEGASTIASGSSAHAEGQSTTAYGDCSHSQGSDTFAIGGNSHAAGKGIITKEILSVGYASFNHSQNNTSQTVGHGALAVNSAIIGGINHNIATGNTRAAIIGGNAIKLTGSTYTDTTAVANLAIMSTPSAGVTGDSVLVRRGTTGKIHAVAQSSIGGSGGVSTATFNSYTGTTTTSINDLNAQLDLNTAIVSGGVMALNFNSKKQIRFECVTAITSNFSITFTGATNIKLVTVDLLLTGTIAITLPSSVVTESAEIRFNNSTKVLTLVGVTGSPFELSFTKVGSYYKLRSSLAYYT